ncbi:hypothetical protein [Luteimonas terricola]|nr:hypothetical protein [Luteimonas terricola]
MNRCPDYRQRHASAVETELGETMPDGAAEKPGQHADDMASATDAEPT